MSSVRITIGGREFQVACDDGQENHLKGLARMLDERVKAFGGKPGDPELIMMAGLMLTDELEDARRETSQLRGDLRHNSQSFEINKQIEMENAIAETIHNIAARVEAIAGELEKA